MEVAILRPKAVACASAIVWSGGVFLVGLANLVWPKYGMQFLEVLASIYPGYHAEPSLGSVIVGAVYAAVDGAIGGLILAWLYNRCASCQR